MNELNDIVKNLSKHFNGKVIWITGGGSGIGKCLAIELAGLGANVIISGRNEKNLREVATDTSNIIPIKLDVSQENEWQKAVEKFQEKFTKLDMVIFNAGSCEYIDLPKFHSEVFEQIFAVNFMGIVRGLESVLPILLDTHGSRIVAVTSSVAALPLPRAEAYGASKAASTSACARAMWTSRRVTLTTRSS